jgi:hypothetical protein
MRDLSRVIDRMGGTPKELNGSGFGSDLGGFWFKLTKLSFNFVKIFKFSVRCVVFGCVLVGKCCGRPLKIRHFLFIRIISVDLVE